MNIDFKPLEIQLNKAKLRYQSINTDVSQPGDSFRIFHGRGGAYANLDWLTIDFFYPTWVITIFSNVDSYDLHKLTNLLLEHVNSCQLNKPICVLLQRRYLPHSPWDCILGEVSQSLTALENGLAYQLSTSQQNIGFFLDIAPTRAWLKKIATGKNILNLFSYTCSFSVVASEAQAKQIVNIDLSKRSLEVGRRNHFINNLDTKNVKFLAHDILKSWGKLKKYGPYDIVIVDPPSFQKGSFIATKDYIKILNRLDVLVEDKGLAVLCLNSPEVTYKEFHTFIETSLVDAKLNHTFTYCYDIKPSDDFVELQKRALKVLVYQKN